MKNFKDKKSEDLKEDIEKSREEMRLIRFGKSGSKTKNVKEMRGLKKAVARMLTELRARVQ